MKKLDHYSFFTFYKNDWKKSGKTSYQRNKEVILYRGKTSYKNNEEVLIEKVRKKHRELSAKQNDKKREYVRNRYKTYLKKINKD